MKKIGMLLWYFYGVIAYAALNISMEPNPAVLGQDVQLILTKTDAASSDLPDLLSLEKDFLVVGTQQSSRYENINGKTHQETTWVVLLNPKHEGKITIPAIRWGQESTQTLELDVQAMSSKKPASGDTGESVFLKWELEPQAPMVHEQVKLKLKIYHSEPLLDAKLIPPSVENGLLFALDNQQHLFEILNNQRYQVEQYRYIIYPQNQGKMTIQGPVLDALEYGVVPTPVHKVLPNKTLNINPAQQAHWLPVQNLSYQELIPVGKQIGVHAQDTIVRKIEITAQGIPAQLIPDIQSSCGQSCKVYSNPPKIENKMMDGELYGQKTFEITYLPEQAGHAKIESIEIPWFNTQTRKSQKLVIPSISIDVFKPKQETSQMITSNTKNSGWSVAFWTGLLGFIGGALLFWISKHVSWQRLLENIQAFELRHYSLKKACFKNDAQSARLGLLKWANDQHFQYPIRDLHDIARQIPDNDLKIEIKSLIAHLFSRRQDKAWQGQRLWRSFRKFQFVKKPKANDESQTYSLNP
jgi:hypothetical protein